MTNLAPFISAIAALLWPALGFTVLALYHEELRDLLQRIKRGKFLGQEIELKDSLAELNASAQEAIAAAEALPAPLDSSPQSGTDVQELLPAVAPEEASPRVIILEEVARSPKAALVLLASDIDRAVRNLIVNLGLAPPGKAVSTRQSFEMLSVQKAIPESLLRAVDAFSQIRNRIVHGFHATDDEILSAIDSGLLILEALSIVPHATHRVYDAAGDLYSDPDGKTPIEGVKALILDNESKPGRGRISKSVHPTTKQDYSKGQLVAWQWNMNRVFGECWYRDPDTSAIKYAWTSSAEFVGRRLD